MILGVIGSAEKKMTFHLLKYSEKMDAEIYDKVLRCMVLLWMKANSANGNHVWTQDSAPTHTAKRV